jgi:spore coat protein U-like protein
MNQIKPFILVGALLLSTVSHAQSSGSSGSVTATTKATATLSAVCLMSTQNVNFGVVSLPVGAQSASANMNIQCTKGSSYTINLSYGGFSGQQTILETGSLTNSTYAYGPSNTWEYECEYQFTYNGQNVSFVNWETKNCTSTGQTNYVTGYAYGKLSGAISGDSIAYSIQVPNKPSETWLSGYYAYSATASGGSDAIPVVATLAPSQTPNQYPSADSYSGTVTATVSY